MRVSILVTAISALLLSMSACDDSGDEERGTAEPGDPCNGTIDCTPGSICWNNICIEEGALRFSLAWTEETDLDLHIETPAGDHIYYADKMAGGGELDVDDCVGGNCTTPDGTHVENVFFDDSTENGTYTYSINNYDCDLTAHFHI